MNIAQLYPKKWLSPEDLAGRTVTVAIASVTLETVRNPRTNREENKLALAFHGKQKRLLINKTQAYALVAVTGSEDTDAWPGHLITLSVTVTPKGAKTFAITPPPDPPAQAPKPPTDGTANGAAPQLPKPPTDGTANGAAPHPPTPTATGDDTGDDSDPGAGIFDGEDEENDTTYTGRHA